MAAPDAATIVTPTATADPPSIASEAARPRTERRILWEPNAAELPPPATRTSTPPSRAPWRLAAVLACAAVGVLVAAFFIGRSVDDVPAGSTVGDAGETPGVVVGPVGGAVVASDSPAPSPTPVPTPSPRPATPAPTATAAPPVVTGPPPPTPVPAVTPAPVAAAPSPSAPPPPPPTPAPSVAVAVAASPADAVAAFYGRAAAADFDGAYALWSQRMRSTYPRQTNLDGRFDQTAAIEFQELTTVANDGSSAVVQANFTEVYDGGSSRNFVGYWELVNVGGAWLLDAPHY
jgi:hypothetical protein